MNQGPKKIGVMAYSGFKANERPLWLVVDGSEVKVKEVLDRWYGADHDFFKVLGQNGRVYLIRWHRARDVWELIGADIGPVYH